MKNLNFISLHIIINMNEKLKDYLSYLLEQLDHFINDGITELTPLKELLNLINEKEDITEHFNELDVYCKLMDSIITLKRGSN